MVLVWIGVLHKLDVRALQSLGGGHYHHLPSGHLGEKHRVLVVDIVIRHTVVQHPSLVSQTLDPEQGCGDGDDDDHCAI